jgi:hypothetical protein
MIILQKKILFNINIVLKIILICLLFLAFLKMPYVYYQFLKIFTFLSLIYISFKYKDKIFSPFFIIFAIFFIPFPSLSFHFKKIIWNIIDLILSIILLLSIFLKTKSNENI